MITCPDRCLINHPECDSAPHSGGGSFSASYNVIVLSQKSTVYNNGQSSWFSQCVHEDLKPFFIAGMRHMYLN